ncbi:cache domain-containing protein [bacterium]|nr:cache domain-containing protein [bacterium]
MSDGSASPGRLAAALAAAGVEYAALTDHDTTRGLAEFELALAQYGIGSLPGVEITVGDPADAIHILAYGVDPENAALQRVLATHRSYRAQRQSLLGTDIGRIRDWWRRLWGRPPALQLERVLPDISEIIKVVHRAGGTAFLAHPLAITCEPAQLGNWLAELKLQGLDGVEALYAGYPPAQCQLLMDLAAQHNLLVSAGSDFHGFDRSGLNQLAIDMPRTVWNAFSGAHGLGIAGTGEPTGAVLGNKSRIIRRQPMLPRKPIGRRRRFALRIVLPTLLATALFITLIYAIILPAFSNSILERKRETIRELTNSAWSILNGYEQEAQAGLITRAEAQQRAIDRLKQIRYGSEQKDYFWITDMQPRMIMHPYRQDLDGADVSDFRDKQDTAMFIEFVNVAREHGAGYVDYYWQWKDDPDRVVPKESYVKRFAPWDWVIGTGIYLDDVHKEINTLTGRLNHLCLGITACVILLLVWITWESLRIETQRNRAEYDLRESHEKYAALVAATTEGTLIVLDGRCSFSNRTMDEMLGYDEGEVAQLDIADLFESAASSPDGALANILAIADGQTAPARFEGWFKTKDGNRINVLLAVTRIALAGKSGVILVARDVSRHRLLESELGQRREQFKTLTEMIDIGVFRTTNGAEPVFEEINPAARRIFGQDAAANPAELRLLDLLSDEEERRQIARRLAAGQELHDHIIQHQTPEGGPAVLALSLHPVRDETGTISHYDGTIEDITAQRRRDEERDTLLQEYQSALLFLNEPLGNIAGQLVRCDMRVPLKRAARIMSRHDTSCLAITSGDSETVIGVVTDHDLRRRVLAENTSVDQPVVSVMSAPVVALPHTAPVYEAILTMQQQDVDHLAVLDVTGAVIKIVRNSDLIQFHQYSSAVITSEIQRAQTIDEIVDARTRLPRLVKILVDSGARPRNINRVMTRLSDAIVERLLDLAMGELGPAPCRFCFLALGSEGRAEQTLVTDQDSALIIEDVTDEATVQAAADYFEKLAELVTSWLNRIGYEYCQGGVMISNRKWRQPLAVWKKYFRDWITGATPEDLLKFNIFFDFRPIGGDRELLRQLRSAIHSIMDDYPPFLLHFALNALLYKPPLGLMGKIVVDPGGAKPNTINIKDAMLSVVNFARLYSLQHRLEETNTLDRLRRLADMQVLRQSFSEEISHAYTFMMELRLNHQAAALVSGHHPDNAIDPKGLNAMQETMLKQSFNLLALIRKKISQDFQGMAT